MSFTWNLLFAVISANVDTGVIHGMGVVQGVVGVAQPGQEKWLQELGMSLSDARYALGNLQNYQSFGYICGSMISLIYARLFGRKGGMLMSAFIAVLSSLACGYCKYLKSHASLILGRFLIGVKIGINNNLSPMYIMEICPTKVRHVYACTYAFGVTIGVCLTFLTGRYLATENTWPFLYSINIFPAFLALVMLRKCPESPRYLYVVKRKELEAKKAYLWLWGSNTNCEAELQMLSAELEKKKVFGETTFKDVANNALYRTALIVCSVLTISIHISGAVNVLGRLRLYYIRKYPDDINHAMLVCDLIQGSASIFGSIMAFPVIYVVDTKKILVYSFVGNFVFLLLAFAIELYDQSLGVPLQICWIIVILIFKISTTSISTYAPSLFFNTMCVPYGYTICFTVGTIGRLIYEISLQPVQMKLKKYMFLNYALINAGFAYYSYCKIPETKDKTLKEIYQELAKLHNLKRKFT